MLPSNIGGNILAFRVALIALHCRPDGDSVRMQKNLTAAISYIFVYFLISYFILLRILLAALAPCSQLALFKKESNHSNFYNVTC